MSVNTIQAQFPMLDFSNLIPIIREQLSESEKALYSTELIEQIVFLYHAMQADYEHNIFDKVHHVDLFFQQGFESYVDTVTICKYIQLELEKDAISIDEKITSRFVESIKRQYKQLSIQPA